MSWLDRERSKDRGAIGGERSRSNHGYIDVSGTSGLVDSDGAVWEAEVLRD